MYNIIAICGEAGTGKDTLMQKILASRPDIHEIISYTSRPIREGEKNGVNYHYCTDEEFLNKVQQNQMLEYTNFNNWYYGTGYGSLREDNLNIGVFNPAGIRSLLKHDNVKVYIIRLLVDDKVRLMRQLTREEHPDVKEIVRRFSTDEQDFSQLGFIPNYVAYNMDKASLENIARVVDIQFPRAKVIN